MLFLFGLVLLSASAGNFYAYRKAQKLLLQARTLEQGKTTVEDVKRRYPKTRVDVLPEASTEEKKRAFQLKFSCIVSLHSCHFPCQIIPLGWLDSLRDRHLQAGTYPRGRMIHESCSLKC